MSRPKGMTQEFTRPSGKKLGRPLGKTKLAEYLKKTICSTDQVLEFKVKILELMSDGECTTLTAAAEKLKLTPMQVHKWAQSDPDFQEMVRFAHEIVADKLELEFQHHANFIPKLMLLKGYRPMFRDNYNFNVSSSKLEELLAELKSIGAGQSSKVEEKTPSDTAPALPNTEKQLSLPLGGV